MTDCALLPLKDYLARSGKTLDEVAEEITRRGFKTTKATLSRVQNGRYPVSLDLLPHLSAVTGISARKLRPDLASLMARPRPRQRAGAAR